MRAIPFKVPSCLRPASGLLLAGWLTACAAAPPCQVERGTPLERPANAGCLIHAEGRLLMVRDRLSGKLGFPAGGSRSPEPSQCTAHRETWEETGYTVAVGRQLAEFGGGFRLYLCHIVSGPEVRDNLPRPPQALLEIEEILWRQPHQLDVSEWRFPSQYPRVLELFDELQSGSAFTPQAADVPVRAGAVAQP